MLSTKSFLKEECQNVERLLRESLRHEYGSSRSSKFYSECLFRLNIISTEIDRAAETDLKKLATFSEQLSKLSALITRIERSHLGEFSWPFANAFEALALATCHGIQPDPAYGEPLFFISSEGGLGAYCIHHEQRSSDIVNRRIFNIVFPRTLKHHVLLHPILGMNLDMLYGQFQVFGMN